MTGAPPFPPATATAAAGGTLVDVLPNGVRLLLLRLPGRATAEVSVFVRSGSAHESRALNGIGHVVEHMVFKGTRSRDAGAINLDAERLGADVNAHTDKDHTAFHMRGLARDALAFVPMLADLVTAPTFPADELERERQVLLQEFVEEEDDPMAAAYRLFDTACYGLHPVAQPAIGRRATVERLQADDLRRWVERQFTGSNLLLAAAGPIDPDAFRCAAEAAFGTLPAGAPHAVARPDWHGGVRTRRLDAGSQTHLVMGWPLPPLGADDPVGELAAACFGEGMSSPLMAELRERRGLVYYAACAADVIDLCGEFVVEASFASDKLDELLPALARLLRAQADGGLDPVALERARNQLAVRWLRAHEKPARRLESAALDLLALGRVRSLDERLARLQAVDAEAVRATFERWQQQAAPAVALAGKLVRGVSERVDAALGSLRRGAPVSACGESPQAAMTATPA